MDSVGIDFPGAAAARAEPKRLALVALAGCAMLAALSTSIANVALPTLAAAFEAPFQHVQWVVLAYLLGLTSVIVSVGRLGDLIGRKRLLVAGLLVFAAGSAAAAAAPDLPLLIAARAAQGVGAAVMTALALALVAEALPKEKTGTAIGLLGAMSAVGTALGPSAGGMVIAILGWRWIFASTAVLALLTLYLVAKSLPDRKRDSLERVRLDVPGTITLGLALGCYALAMTLGDGEFRLTNIVLLAAASTGAVLFVSIEKRSKAPLMDLQAVRTPAVAGGLLTSTLVSTVVMATLVVGPFYLSRSLGLGPASTGAVMAAGPIVAALVAYPAGRLVDRRGSRATSLVGLSVMGTGATALALVPLSLGAGGYLGGIVALTAGYALFQAANNTAAMVSVEPELRGVTSGMLNLARNLGLITGAALLGAVFAAASHGRDDGSAVADGAHVTFAVAAMLVAVAIAIALRSSSAARRPSRQAAA